MKILNPMRAKIAAFIPFLIWMAACNSPEKQIRHMKDVKAQPPVAKKIPKKLEKFGDVRIDNYYWLRERDNPEVLKYLKAENAYTDKVMAPVKAFREKLFQEIKGRIKEDDSSVPYRLDDYYYYTRYVKGGEYPLYCRKKGSMDAEEEVLADGNELGKGHEFFSYFADVGVEHRMMALVMDTVGRRKYHIRIKDLKTGKMLPEIIKDVTGNIAWAGGDRYLFYTRQDPQTLRWYQVFRHKLGEDTSGDQLVYEEKDVTFDCYVSRTKSKKYIMISSSSTLSDEWRYLPADKPLSEPVVIQPRERNLEYSVDHLDGKFYIRTNLNARNFKLVKTPVTAPGKANWKDVISHREDYFLESFELFRDFLVLEEKNEGLTKIRILSWNHQDDHYIDFGEPAYAAWLAYNPEMNTEFVRYGYSSFTTPRSTYDYQMVKREKTLLKRQEVLGDFDPSNYRSERIWVEARDGVKVPLSIVYRKGFEKDGSHPCLIYGYGSYGASMEASFSSYRLSLLDRGFVYALAHVRGGQELGRKWYEDGKLLKKKNTFYDFIDCSKYLIDHKYTKPDKLFAQGGSAGGLLMGAVANMAPELYKGIIAQVPFVDVLTTMLDETIPLTTAEYDEWGNPNEKVYYDYIKSYSPYDNVVAQAYPNMLVTTGLHDSQVQYWEPAKWVAKLRAAKTDDHLLLLHINMEAGHGGASGRFKRIRETARIYAFVLDLTGIDR